MDGLLFTPDVADGIKQTKAGPPVFGGSAIDFPTWKFRVVDKMKMIDATIDQESRRAEKLKLLSRILDGFTDEAPSDSTHRMASRSSLTPWTPAVVAEVATLGP